MPRGKVAFLLRFFLVVVALSVVALAPCASASNSGEMMRQGAGSKLVITVCQFRPWAHNASPPALRRCDFELVSQALAAAGSNSVIVVEQGRYSESLAINNNKLAASSSSSSSSSIRVKEANNVTLEVRGQVVLHFKGAQRMLSLEGDVFTIGGGSLSLINAGISVAAGSRLVQSAELSVSVTQFQTDGVRLEAGASWLQLGDTTISTGRPDAHSDFALAYGVNLADTATWDQRGSLVIHAHGSIGVLVWSGSTWSQSGHANLTVAGQSGPLKGDKDALFGEAVRMGSSGSSWHQTGPVSIVAVDASAGVLVSHGATWFQEAQVTMQLEVQRRPRTVGVKLVGGVWEQQASTAIDLYCPAPPHDAQAGDHQSALCEGVEAPSESVVSLWNLADGVETIISGATSSKGIHSCSDLTCVCGCVQGSRLQRRRVVGGGQRSDDDSNHDHADGTAETSDPYWDALVEPVNDVVKLTSVMALPPPRHDLARIEQFERSFPNGRALEATGIHGRTYQLCPSSSIAHHHGGAARGRLRLRGQRVEGSGACVHASLHRLSPADADAYAYADADELGASAAIAAASMAANGSSGAASSVDGHIRRILPGSTSRGVRPTALLRATFSGLPTYFASLSQVSILSQSLQPFMQRLSSGRVSMPVWYNSNCAYEMSITRTRADSESIGLGEFYDAVKVAAAAHRNPACRLSEDQWNAYAHAIIVLPWCGQPWGGLASMPGTGSVLNGDATVSMMAHEVGHNLGLPHGSAIFTAMDSQRIEYGNVFEIMGSVSPNSNFPNLISYLVGYQDALGWLGANNKASYPPGAFDNTYAADGTLGTIPAVATYSLAGIEDENGVNDMETVRIPMARATLGHYNSWLYLNWFRSSTGQLRTGVLMTEESLDFLWNEAAADGARFPQGLLFDAAPGTVTLRDATVTAGAPMVYGMGGMAPVLIEMAAVPATSDTRARVKVTRLRPSGERLDGRGCSRAIGGCESGSESVPVQACGTTVDYAGSSVVFRVASATTTTSAQAVSISVSGCSATEVGIFHTEFPVGQFFYGSPPRVRAQDATATLQADQVIEAALGVEEPLWVAARTTVSGSSPARCLSATPIRVTLTCANAVANSRRRIRFDSTGSTMSSLARVSFELSGARVWIVYQYGVERRLQYDSGLRRWRYMSYSMWDDNVLISEDMTQIVSQATSPFEWNGVALFGQPAPQVRHLCPRGMYAPSDNMCAACPDFTTTGYAGATYDGECSCRPGYAPSGPNGECRQCPADTYSLGSGSSCIACASGTTSPPGSPVASYCRPRTPWCRKLFVKDLITDQFGSQLDGFYLWDGLDTWGANPRYRFAGGFDVCVARSWDMSWSWQSCSQGKPVMGDLGGTTIIGSTSNLLPGQWPLPSSLVLVTGKSSTAWPAGGSVPSMTCVDQGMPSASPSASPSPSFMPQPSPGPLTPNCGTFVLSGFNPTQADDPNANTLGLPLNGYYEWDGVLPDQGKKPRYRLITNANAGLPEICLMTGWADDVWAWRTCSGVDFPGATTGDYIGFAILEGDSPASFGSASWLYFGHGSSTWLDSAGSPLVTCNAANPLISVTPTPSASPSLPSTPSPSAGPRIVRLEITAATGVAQPASLQDNIPLGTYTWTGASIGGAPAYELDGMFLTLHAPSRSWGFTQRPELDGTERWAVTDPVPTDSSLAEAPLGDVPVRLFDGTAKAFSIAATLRFGSSLVEASPSSTPLPLPTSTPSPMPSPSSTPTSSRVPSPSSTPTPTTSPLPTITPSAVPSPSSTTTASPSFSSSQTPMSTSPMPSSTSTPSVTPSRSSSPTASSWPTPSQTSSSSPSTSSSASATASATQPGATVTATSTATTTPTITSPTATPTSSASRSASPLVTASSTALVSSSTSASASPPASASSSPSSSGSPSASASASRSPSASSSLTTPISSSGVSASPSISAVPSHSASVSASPSMTPSPSPSTSASPSRTMIPSPGASASASISAAASPSASASSSASPSMTPSPLPSASASPSRTVLPSSSASASASISAASSPSASASSSASPSRSPSASPSRTADPSSGASVSASATPTPSSVSATPSLTPTRSASSSATATVSSSATRTGSPSVTLTVSPTRTPSGVSVTPTATPTRASSSSSPTASTSATPSAITSSLSATATMSSSAGTGTADAAGSGSSGGDVSTAGIAAAVIVPVVLVLAAIAAIVVVLFVRRYKSGAAAALRRRTVSISGSSPLYDFSVEKGGAASSSSIVDIMHNDIYQPSAQGFHSL